MAKEVQEGTGINAAKLKALQATIDKIEKDYGKGTIMKLGDQPKWEVSVIPSGSIALDAALGIGAISFANFSAFSSKNSCLQ